MNKNIKLLCLGFLGIIGICILINFSIISFNNVQRTKEIVFSQEENKNVTLSIKKLSNEVSSKTASYEVNAQVLPETDSIDRSLNWYLSWNNENIQLDINNYISLEVSDDTHNVVIHVINRPSFQVLITAQSILTPSVKASATIDFYKFISDTSIPVISFGSPAWQATITNYDGIGGILREIDCYNYEWNSKFFTDIGYQDLYLEGNVDTKITFDNYLGLSLSEKFKEFIHNISTQALIINYEEVNLENFQDENLEFLLNSMITCDDIYLLFNELKANDITHLFDLRLTYKVYDINQETLLSTTNITYSLKNFNYNNYLQVTSINFNTNGITL